MRLGSFILRVLVQNCFSLFYSLKEKKRKAIFEMSFSTKRNLRMQSLNLFVLKSGKNEKIRWGKMHKYNSLQKAERVSCQSFLEGNKCT